MPDDLFAAAAEERLAGRSPLAARLRLQATHLPLFVASLPTHASLIQDGLALVRCGVVVPIAPILCCTPCLPLVTADAIPSTPVVTLLHHLTTCSCSMPRPPPASTIPAPLYLSTLFGWGARFATTGIYPR